MRAQNSRKKPLRLLIVFQKYWLITVLLVVLITLIRQNFIINKFPFSLNNKRQIIKQNISLNADLSKKNEAKKTQLSIQTDANMEALESNARYRFGLIKKNETYYQINNP